MIALFWGTGVFIVAFALHAAIWRLAPPRNSGVALLTVFAATFVVLSAVTWVAGAMSWKFPLLPVNLLQYLHACVLFAALTCAYIMTYPAIEVESPSLIIAELTAACGRAGLQKANLYRVLDDKVIFWPRVQNLLDEKAAVLDQGRYRSTPKGTAIARLFNAYRGLLRASDRGG